MRKQIPPEGESDAELSHKARNGDRRAWRKLIRRHTPKVYRLAARMLGPGAEAEDATQEAFVKMHRSFDSYDPTRPLGPWLGRITYHVCLKRMTKAGKSGIATDPANMQHVEDTRFHSAEQVTASRQAGALVLQAMERLSAQDRALVTLRYQEGMTDVEVGETVGMNRNTVRTRLHRARKVLRKALAPVFGGGSA